MRGRGRAHAAQRTGQRRDGEEQRRRDRQREIARVDALVPLLEEHQVRRYEQRDDADAEQTRAARLRERERQQARGDER